MSDFAFSSFIKNVTNNYLDNLSEDNLPPISIVIEDLITISNNKIDEYNLGPLNEESDISDPINVRYPYQRKGSKKFRNLTDLHPYQVAKLCILYFKFRKIQWSYSSDENMNYSFAAYRFEGSKKGLYDTDKDFIESKIQDICVDINNSDLEKCYRILKKEAPFIMSNTNVDLIAVNNGIFDYKEKKLLDFDPKYVFLSKSPINYNPSCSLVNIKMHDGELWNVEDWLSSLVHDDVDKNILWQIISASLRHTVTWNKAVFLYATSGNNGKGTFCALLRNLVGKSSYAAIPIRAFSKDFTLEPLLTVSNVIADENDTTGFLTNAENFKNAITQDEIFINIKYQKPINFVFKGLIVQCINNIFKVADKSDSLYRRLFFVRMDKKFQGVERRYIKGDYIKRQEVLEYVLYKALMDESFFVKTEYDDDKCTDPRYMFHMSKRSYELLQETKVSNDPVRQFLEEHINSFTWDLLPTDFIYGCYKEWFKQNVSESGKFLGKNNFIKEVNGLIDNTYLDWEYNKNGLSFSTYCNKPEPLILKYNVKDFINKSYKGLDEDILASPKFGSKRFRGFVRKNKKEREYEDE